MCSNKNKFQNNLNVYFSMWHAYQYKVKMAAFNSMCRFFYFFLSYYKNYSVCEQIFWLPFSYYYIMICYESPFQHIIS